MVLVPILSFLLLGGQWMVGWASAPYDPAWAARHPRKAALMALAGPVANLLLLVVAMLALRVGLATGWFVTIEGPEGAGKTTQATLLRERAAAAGVEIVLTREPGGTVLGERIRDLVLDPDARHDARTDALLFNAARARLVDEVIRPARAAGALVVATRFADSTLVAPPHGAAPTTVDSAANGASLSKSRVMAVISGGVRVDLSAEASSAAIQVDDRGRLAKERQSAAPVDLPTHGWWWD